MNNNKNLKAIQTEYDGFLFRSRLEARWAVLLNTLGIEYEYEKEGYQLDSGWYLPDFWLPGEQVWLEIKGGNPTVLELKKLEELSISSGNKAFLCYGSKFVMDNSVICYGVDWAREGQRIFWDMFYTEISYESILIDGLTPLEKWNKALGYCDKGIELIDKAVLAAKQARFEHGQSGASR